MILKPIKLLNYSLFFLFLSSFTSLYAQVSIGLETGYTKNYFTTSTGYRNFVAYKPAESFSVGLPIKYTFNRWLSVTGDPQFINKSYEYYRTENYDGIYQKNTNSYLQLPLLAQFSYKYNKYKAFVGIGGYAGYWISGKLKGKMPNIFDKPSGEVLVDENIFYDEAEATYNEAYVFDKVRDKRVDAGLALSFGLGYSINPKYEIFVEGRYYRSLLDQQKKYMMNQIPNYNDTYVVQIGFLYHFSL